MSYNLSYVSSGQGGPTPGAPPAGAAPGPGMPPPYTALPYSPAPPPGYAPGMGLPGQAPPMMMPGQAPPMMMPGQAPPMMMPGQAPSMVMPGQAPPMGMPEQAPPTSINMGPVYNAPVPLITTVPRPMQDGQTIHITGTIPQNPKRFHINLSLGSGSNKTVGTVMHLNPRWDENPPVIVRNSFLKNKWGKEERWGEYFPLGSGQNFECIILVQSDCYKVAFNGHHFCEYKHRHPKNQVTHLVIEGDVSLACVWCQGPVKSGGAMPGVTIPPMLPAGAHTFKVPHKQEIPGALNVGRMIYISGTPNTPSYDRFEINFGYDINFKKDIAFHFNPRYKDKVVVRNTKAGFNWGKEERNQPEFPFHPGKLFDIIVLVEKDQYKVAVNGQHFITYQHRLRNLAHIKFLEIGGDITLTSVRV